MFPVAMQKDAVAQETDVRCTGPPSALASGPDNDQAPLEYAYTVVAVLVAMQKAAVGHDTNDSPLLLTRRGGDHELPEYV